MHRRRTADRAGAIAAIIAGGVVLDAAQIVVQEAGLRGTGRAGPVGAERNAGLFAVEGQEFADRRAVHIRRRIFQLLRCRTAAIDDGRGLGHARGGDGGGGRQCHGG